MKQLNRTNTGLEKRMPVKIVQFGEGNFLRAFVDYSIQELNDKANFKAGVAVVQPIDRGLIQMLNDQDGLYTLFMKGIQKGEVIQEKMLISSIVKGVDPYANFEDYMALAEGEDLAFIISNTTESGIAYVSSDTPDMAPPSSFPAKLTVFLNKRFTHFKGAPDKGLTIIPCELINYNADTLKDIILTYAEDWKLGEDFNYWIEHHNSFHNTLVDRIVPGYPRDEIEAYNQQLDYKDNLIVTAEKFFLWVIEGDEKLKAKLPFHQTDLEVAIVEDMQPYRTRKVRILNGAHTAMVPFSILFGNETVEETVDHPFTGPFVQKAVFDEIIDTLDMDKAELVKFAEEVFDRFRNPFIKHMLSSIALNSISKFKVRVLPSLLGYIDLHGKLPLHLTYAFACLIRFYKGTWQGKVLPVDDDGEITAFFTSLWNSGDYDEIATTTLAREDYWGQDLNQVPGLTAAMAAALQEIDANGIQEGFTCFTNYL